MSLRLTVLIAALFVLTTAPASSAATRPLADGQTFADAYQAAGAGDVIEVGPGARGPQEVPAGTKAVTFRGLPGNKVQQISNNASNVTFDGIDVDAGFAKLLGFYSGEATNVTFRNGRVGNVVDEKGVMLGGWSSAASQGVVFDNVEFHDVLQRGADVHNECVYSQSPGLTIRNSVFRNCATMDVMITRGSWWGQPSYGGITLENNVFAHSVNGSDPDWHYYGFLVHGQMGQLTDARIVNNTFETPVGGVTSEEIQSASGVWANNIGGGWDCLPGMIYRGNVGKRCDGSDVAVSPDHSCAPPTCSPAQTMPVGWADPSKFDFHLTAGSVAIGAGDPGYATARDRDGKPRDNQPDAGAHEHGTGGATSGTPAPTSTPAAGWRLTSARLKPKVICRRARAHCPRSTKLRLRLGRPARVRVKVLRLRKNRAPKRVRVKRLRKVRLHKATHLSARGLAAGRYRVVVRARDAAGAPSAPVRLRLRVR